MLTKFRNKFNFNGLIVSVESDCYEIQQKLDKDFSFFKTTESKNSFQILNIYKVSPPLAKIPKVKETFSRKYSKTFDEGRTRFNNYGGKALTIINYETEVVDIYSLDESLLHELSYLIILSRIGKKMDLMGIHRIHAMAFRVGDVDSVFMMNMGGGKSTLLSHLMNYEDVELISDDTPLVNSDGRVIAFPLRLGAYPELINEILNPNENIYELVRQEFGKKRLISIDGVTNKIAESGLEKRQVFFQGKRVEGSSSRFYKANIFQKIYYLIYNMVIGFGLPMIFEYFWELGPRDFYRKSKIALSRLVTMIKIISTSEFYIFETGNNPEHNGKLLYDFLKKK